MHELTNREWYDGLKEENQIVEKRFYQLIVPMIRKACSSYQLSEDEEAEVIIYAMMATIRHIQTERYVFQNYAPSTYTVSIAKWKALSEVRKRPKVIIDDFAIPQDFEEDFYTYLEKSLWYNQQFLSAFQQLQPDCQTIVEAHYNEGLSDSEIANNPNIPQNNRVNVNRRKGNCIEFLKKLLQKTNFFD